MSKSHVFIILLLGMAQACTPVVPLHDISIPTSTVTKEVLPSPAMQMTETPAPLRYTPPGTPKSSTQTPKAAGTLLLSPSPTALDLCLRVGGRVEVHEITTILLPDPLVFRIYLPPCYDEEPERVYPLLYLIHGQSYSDTQWDRLGVPQIADRLIATGETTPFIVVMPRDRVWLEPTEDDFGLAVEQSLIPWMDEHYRTIPERDYRAIGGLSRGGAWALHIGFSNPDLFGAIGLHSGFIFHSDVQPLRQWLDNLSGEMLPRIYMDIADADRLEITQSAAWLEDIFTSLGIPHEWHIFLGQHNESYWQAHVEDYLRWYSQGWGK